MNNNLTAEEKIKRDDRIRYYVVKLKDVMSKNKLFKLIEENGVTSNSTAERVSKGVFDWNKGEIELFLATYYPTKSDSKAIDEFLGLNASKVSSEVAEDDKCTECDIEAMHIINELSAKNQELQKELHTSKNVITTLQKGVEELNEAITESKCMIAEVAKERDDKDEEIRVLGLELQKYKNDLNAVLGDRQKLECLLSDNANAIGLNPKYDSLYKVLLAAYNQASNGKGKERHQLNDDEPFENQKICEIARRLSIDYNLGQAVKKIYESKRLTDERDIAELYGAINYIAAAIIVKQEDK